MLFPAQSHSSETTGKERVLIADHYAGDADALAAVARDLGHATQVLNHSSAFAEAYDSFDPTLIVLNLYLPQFDGIDATRWLVGRNNRARLALVSHHGSLFARAAEAIAELAGFPVCFFAKPLNEGTIAEIFNGFRPARISRVPASGLPDRQASRDLASGAPA